MDMTFYGYEHSVFYPCDSFFIINILFYPQSAFYPWSAVCRLQSAFYTDHSQALFMSGASKYTLATHGKSEPSDSDERDKVMHVKE